MLKFNKVSFRYTKDSPEILKDFSVDFPKNKISVIMSPNGLGKTTILKLASKIIYPDSGNIINNNKKISYVFQEDRLIDELSVYENLKMILDIRKPKFAKEKAFKVISQMLKLLGIEQYINCYPSELSGSMKKRVAIARAFLHPSQLLLMDEPFNNLDIELKLDIMKTFAKLWTKNKRTVLFVTHSADEALTLANRIYFFGKHPMKVIKTLDIKGNIKNRDISSKPMVKYRRIILNYFFNRVKEEHK
ncbi:MAG: ABC transporter ATP-binding protein [Malacoplasma sp.]|nr:ABC transporter ATP-binding protein [Malacoplasma sp.]